MQEKKKKNISLDGLGTKHGRIHIKKQTINLQTRKMKGLKKTKAEKKVEKAALGKRRAATSADIANKKAKAD